MHIRPLTLPGCGNSSGTCLGRDCPCDRSTVSYLSSDDGTFPGYSIRFGPTSGPNHVRHSFQVPCGVPDAKIATLSSSTQATLATQGLATPEMRPRDSLTFPLVNLEIYLGLPKLISVPKFISGAQRTVLLALEAHYCASPNCLGGLFREHKSTLQHAGAT